MDKLDTMTMQVRDFCDAGSVEKVGVAPEPKRVGPASGNLEYG